MRCSKQEQNHHHHLHFGLLALATKMLVVMTVHYTLTTTTIAFTPMTVATHHRKNIVARPESLVGPLVAPMRYVGEARPLTTPPFSLSVSSLGMAVNGESRRGKKTTTTPQITTINSLEEFLAFLGQDSRLCIIKFHASWCKSCQKFGLRFSKLASDEGDLVDKKRGSVMEEGRVRFAQVEFTKNAKLCRTLGIKRLPYVHMYRGSEGRLCDFACGPNKFSTVIDKMEEYLGMTQEEIDFKREMDAGEILGEEILARLRLENQSKEEREKQKKKQQEELVAEERKQVDL